MCESHSHTHTHTPTLTHPLSPPIHPAPLQLSTHTPTPTPRPSLLLLLTSPLSLPSPSLAPSFPQSATHAPAPTHSVTHSHSILFLYPLYHRSFSLSSLSLSRSLARSVPSQCAGQTSDHRVVSLELLKKCNPINVAYFGVLLVRQSPYSDKFGEADLTPYTQPSNRIRDVAIFCVSTNVARFWGFNSVAALLPLIAPLTTATAFICRHRLSHCHPTVPTYIQHGMQPVPPYYPCYTAYGEPPPPIDIDLNTLTEAVMARFRMYRGKWHKAANNMIYMPSPTHAYADYAAYCLVMAVLRDPAFRYRYQHVSAETVCEKWLECEMAIIRERVVGMTLPHAVFLLKKELGECQILHKDDSRNVAFTGMLDLCCREFVLVPFENIPALVRCRRILLKKGWGIVGSNHAEEMVYGCLRQRLRKQWLYNHHYKQIDAPNLQHLVEYIHKQFEDICCCRGNSGDGTILKLLKDINDIRMYVPRCIQRLCEKATDTRRLNEYLHFDERGIYSRFLYDVGWSADDVLHQWKPKLLLLKNNKVPNDIISKLKVDEKHALANRRNSASAKKTASRSCRGMCEGEYCPYANDRQKCKDDFVTRFKTMNLAAAALPKESFFSPFTFTQTLATSAAASVSSSSSSSSS